MALWTFARTPLVIYNFALNATQNMAAINIISIGANIIRLTLAIIFVYLGLGITGLIASNIISEIFLYLTERLYFRNRFKEYNLSWFIYKPDLSNKMFRFGLQYWGVNVSVIFLLGSDSIIVGSIYGAAVASVFYTTKMPASLLTTFLFKIVDNASPAFNELMGKRLIDEVKSAYLKLLKYMFLVVIPCAIGIIYFSNDLISEWVGEGQYAGFTMSVSLALFLVLQIINHTNSLVMLAVGDLKIWAILSIISGCLNLPISYFFGKYFGMEWVVMGMCISMVPLFIFMFYKSLYELKLSLQSVLSQSIIPAFKSCLPLILLSLLSYSWYQFAALENGILFLLFFMFIFSFIWFSGMWIFGLNKNEKERLLSLIKFYKMYS
jgi:PST family polysaccharide transporter/lipopolysaccharide exporter